MLAKQFAPSSTQLMMAQRYLRQNPGVMKAVANASLMQRHGLIAQPTRGFRQVNNLHEITYTADMELHQRTSKYLERTDKVYKPS